MRKPVDVMLFRKGNPDMERKYPPVARAWRAAVVFAAVLLVASQQPPLTTEASSASTLTTIPPVGGTVIAISGVSDPLELVSSAPFTVATIAAFDVGSQSFSMYVPGGPSFINADLAKDLRPETIVWLTRGQGPSRTGAQSQGSTATGQPTGPLSLRAPRPGGLTIGPAGTTSLEALIKAQNFSVASVILFDTASQSFLTYVPGAPSQLNSLIGVNALASDSLVWLRRSPADTGNLVSSGAPRFAGTAAVTNVDGPTSTARQPDVPSAPLVPSAPSAPAATPTATPTPSAAPPSSSSGTRDPFLWPFSPTSPWNHPIGSNAQYAGASNGITQTLRGEASSAGMNVTHWTIPVFRAEGPERTVSLPNGNVVARLQVPDGARPTPPLVPGDCDTGGAATEGWADAHMNLVTSDARVLELYAAKRLCNGNLETKYDPWWHDLRGSGIGPRAGSHTGSRAYGGSSLGGLVRKWELESGEIRHALAAGLPPARFKSGYVWPATSQDNSHATNYRGNVPMGTLAALPANFDLDSISYSSPYGRAIAKAMRDYGIYFVDSAGSGGMKFYGEPSIQQLPGWQRINDDLRKILPHIQAVTNNGPNSVGGGGTPIAPLAPPLR